MHVCIYLCVCVCTYGCISLPHAVYIFVYVLMMSDILFTMDHNDFIFSNEKSQFSKPCEIPWQLSSGEIVVTKPLPPTPLGGLGKWKGLASGHKGRLEQMDREHGSLHGKETKAFSPKPPSFRQCVAPFQVHAGFIYKDLFWYLP